MNKIKDKIWLLTAAVFAICLTIFSLSYIVTEPWHIVPAAWGDGAKNFFTYVYHCVYGKGYWFDGMNYPYGEHIVYADGEPLLSSLFAYFNNVSPGIALSTLWLLIGLSYVLCVIYIYLILVYFRVSQPIAIIFAGLISICSPQVFRLEAQYSLSYLCVVPMLFYWTIKYNNTQRLKYCIYIFVLGVVSSFLHPYFAGMMMLWGFSYVAGYFIFTGEQTKQKIKHTVPILTSIISILATMGIVMHITDPLKDRPQAPLNTLDSATHISDIFMSGHSPVWRYIFDHNMFSSYFNHFAIEGEGYTYPGIVIIIVLVCTIISGIYSKLKKNKAVYVNNNERFSGIWLFMAFSTLLVSMGVPFIWHLEWLLDYMSVFRQFRALGRFSWIFYYIISIYGTVIIWNAYSKFIANRRFVIGYAILLLPVGIWSLEASGNIKQLRETASQANGNYNYFFSIAEANWESNLRAHNFSKNDFQAIIALCFYDVGSEKLWVGGPSWEMSEAAKAAIQLHLPIVDVAMSRSSWALTEKQVKIVGGPYVTKPILSDIKSNKPFLLLRYDHDSLSDDEKYLLESSDYIGHCSRCKAYAFYPGRQLANDKRIADSINKILPLLSNGDTCIVNKGEWYLNHLDQGNAKKHFFGKGAMTCIGGGDSSFALIHVKPMNDNQEYEFSCWFLLDDNNSASPNITIESLDSAGHTIETTVMNTATSVDNNGLWFRASLYFNLKANCRAIGCHLSNQPNPSYKAMDEILLRPADAFIISKADDGSVMVNNHLFRKGS